MRCKSKYKKLDRFLYWQNTNFLYLWKPETSLFVSAVHLAQYTNLFIFQFVYLGILPTQHTTLISLLYLQSVQALASYFYILRLYIFSPLCPAASLQVLNEVEVEYVTVPGWTTDISNVRKFDDLPEAAQNYVTTVEKYTGLPGWYNKKKSYGQSFAVKNMANLTYCISNTILNCSYSPLSV